MLLVVLLILLLLLLLLLMLLLLLLLTPLPRFSLVGSSRSQLPSLIPMLLQHPLILTLDQLLRTPPHKSNRVSQHFGRLPNLDMNSLEPHTFVLVPRQRQHLARVLRVVPGPLVKDERKLVSVFGSRQLGVEAVVVAVEPARSPVKTGETRVVPLLDLGPGKLEVVFVVDDEEILLGRVLDVLLFASTTTTTVAAAGVGGGGGEVFVLVGNLGCFVVCGKARRA